LGHKTKGTITRSEYLSGQKKVIELEGENLCGYIFKLGSPGSGMERVKVYDQNGVPAKIGVGMFARAFMEHFPLLPVEEEGRLNDLKFRENFIERIFALKRRREAIEGRKSVKSLIDFHTRHKLLILSDPQSETSSNDGKARGESKRNPLEKSARRISGSSPGSPFPENDAQ